jgi:hypothetical protein
MLFALSLLVHRQYPEVLSVLVRDLSLSFSRLPPAWFASRLPSAAKSRIVLDPVAACVPDDNHILGRSSAQHICW